MSAQQVDFNSLISKDVLARGRGRTPQEADGHRDLSTHSRFEHFPKIWDTVEHMEVLVRARRDRKIIKVKNTWCTVRRSQGQAPGSSPIEVHKLCQFPRN